MTLQQYRNFADEFRSAFVALNFDGSEPTASSLEEKYWEIVETNPEHIEVALRNNLFGRPSVLSSSSSS